MNRTGQRVRSGSPKPEVPIVRVQKLRGQLSGSTKPKAWNPSSLFPGKPKKPVDTESWWIGLSREALNEEAVRRHPGTDTGRPSMPSAHARGALKGR